MKFKGGDIEPDGIDNICCSDCEKWIFVRQYIFSEILLCASTVYENVMYPTCEVLAGAEVRSKGLVVDSLDHAPITIIIDS